MKLSVAVVTYNQERYISQCLDGILMQQVDFDYEIVIGEDCGDDATRTICEEYAKKYSQIRLLPKQERLGVCRNWKKVLSSCQGEYVAFCEGDDYWTDKNKLQLQIDYLDAHQDSSLCYTDCDIYYEDTQSYKHSIVKNKYAYVDSLNPIKSKGYQCNVSWVFRRNLWGEMNIPDDCVDFSLVLLYELYLKGLVTGLSPSTGVYRRRLGSESHDDLASDKMYQFIKGSFLIKDAYVMLFPNGEEEKYNLYSSALSLLYATAIQRNDVELVTMFEHYFQENIRRVLQQLEQFRQNIGNLHNSCIYKLKRILLKPYLFFKNKTQ